MAVRKQIEIEILRNYNETGYEVYIMGNRADQDQENKILFAAREELRKNLPVSKKTIWIG